MKGLIFKIILTLLGLGFIAGVTGAVVFIYFNLDLPKLDKLQDYKPNIASQIYSKDGYLLAELGLEKREIVETDQQTQTELPIIKTTRFIKPTKDEVFEYMVEKEFEFAKIESEKFINFFESKGWKVGKTPMKSWKSAVANWMINYYDRNKIQTNKKSKLEVIQQSHASNEDIDWNEIYKENKNEQFN